MRGDAPELIYTGVLASDRDDLADALHDIYTRRRDMLIVRGVFDRDQMARIVADLEANKDQIAWTPQADLDPSVPQMLVLGQTLTPNAGYPEGPALDGYFDHADDFRRRSTSSRSAAPTRAASWQCTASNGATKTPRGTRSGVCGTPRPSSPVR